METCYVTFCCQLVGGGWKTTYNVLHVSNVGMMKHLFFFKGEVIFYQSLFTKGR